MQDKRKNNGGARAGAGRKPKPKVDKLVTNSIQLKPALWDKLDQLKGSPSRGVYLSGVISELWDKHTKSSRKK